MASPFTDTIIALSSGGLPSAVAVVRVSGPAVRDCLTSLTGAVPAPRHAVLRSLRDGEDLIDESIVIFFEAPASFTGEDCAEFQIHGGRAVVARLLETLLRQPKLRAAEAGEFTRRAFVNGRIDLTGAEALADLIDAETEAQRRFAAENQDRRHAELYGNWRAQLLQMRALVEADLDFSDEGDVASAGVPEIGSLAGSLVSGIRVHLQGYATARIIRDGFRVVLIGPPNAGKSSLLNALAQQDIAIVTEFAGTTRDPVNVVLDVMGYKVVLTDTAGLRETEDPIERIGVDKSVAAAGIADLILELDDGREPYEVAAAPGIPRFMLRSKSDLLQPDCLGARDAMRISSVTGEGVDELLELIGAEARKAGGHVHMAALPFRARHVRLLEETVRHLEDAVCQQEPELAAEELRLASRALERITGTIDVEDLLGEIFSRFCVGK